jgi:copper chaperone CopZ
VPGRIRIKTPFIKGSPVKAQEIEMNLKSIYGVRSAYANALTGSVLINYDSSAVEADEILNLACKEGHFDLSKAMAPDGYAEGGLSKTGEAIGKVLLGMVIGKVFEGSPLALLSAII